MKQLLVLALAMQSALAGINITTSPPNTVTVQVEKVPDSFTFSWRVKGTMIGTCAIAITPDGDPTHWFIKQPPADATCNRIWYYDTGPIVSGGSDCPSSFSWPWQVFTKESAPGSQWVYRSAFTWNDFASGCCMGHPPQNCSGNYNAPEIRCLDYCGPPIQVEKVPESFHFEWRVTGWMNGTCSVAVGLTTPTWIMSPPPTATCETAWFYDTGTLISNGEDCVASFNTIWRLFFKESAVGSEWHEVSTFTWNMFTSGFCQQPPPQSGSGSYDISPFACEDYCEPNPFATPPPRPTPTPKPRS